MKGTIINIVTGEKGDPSGVLIRREIILGKDPKELKGPAHIINALKIGAKISEKPSDKKTELWLEDSGIKVETSNIKKLLRVGVGYASK